MSETVRYPPIRSTYDMTVYRVVIVQQGREYTIHTGDGMVRIFMDDKLPKDIASKLSMIKAYEALVPAEQLENMSTHAPYIRKGGYPDDFADIGWHIGSGNDGRKMYCVLIARNLLYQLRGEEGDETV